MKPKEIKEIHKKKGCACGEAKQILTNRILGSGNFLLVYCRVSELEKKKNGIRYILKIMIINVSTSINK